MSVVGFVLLILLPSVLELNSTIIFTSYHLLWRYTVCVPLVWYVLVVGTFKCCTSVTGPRPWSGRSAVMALHGVE